MPGMAAMSCLAQMDVCFMRHVVCRRAARWVSTLHFCGGARREAGLRLETGGATDRSQAGNCFHNCLCNTCQVCWKKYRKAEYADPEGWHSLHALSLKFKVTFVWVLHVCPPPSIIIVPFPSFILPRCLHFSRLCVCKCRTQFLKPHGHTCYWSWAELPVFGLVVLWHPAWLVNHSIVKWNDNFFWLRHGQGGGWYL